jgi:ferredoxin
MFCGACANECMNDAISESSSVYVIDPDKCTECVGNYESLMCAEVCPRGVPVPDPEHRETKEQLMKKWHRLHPGKIPIN